jgi:hypothetical protein
MLAEVIILILGSSIFLYFQLSTCDLGHHKQS